MLLSIMGMYDYDQTIFDGLIVPEDLNRDDLIDNILIECAELEIVYPEYDTLKRAIGIWARSNQYTWEKLLKTTNIEYNPIWNVDANITDQEQIAGNRNIGRTENGSNIRSVKGFNETSWADAEKNTISDSENVNENSDTDRIYTQRRTGNIGVTTTQAMLREEREIATFNLINYITQEFKKRFCLLVY